MSVLTSSSHRNCLFLLQLEPYLEDFLNFCFCRAEPVRLCHKMGKRNSFVSCSPYIPESLSNGFSKFLINPRDWVQVSQGRAVCAWWCVYSGLPGMLFFEGISLPKEVLFILDSPQGSLSFIPAPVHGIQQILCWGHTFLFQWIYPL